MGNFLWKNNEDICGLTTLTSSAPIDYAVHLHENHWQSIVNRIDLLHQLGLKLDQIVIPAQCHSCNVKQVFTKDGGKGIFYFDDGIFNVDALYTKDKQLALAVMHADCAPILLWSKQDQLIMAIHAGWSGSVNKITSKVITKVITDENINPTNFKVFIGPCIHQKSLEVGKDVVDLVDKTYLDEVVIEKGGKYFLDIVRLNVLELLSCGIDENNIEICDIDTYTNQNAFSYRKDKNCGRHFTLIMLK